MLILGVFHLLDRRGYLRRPASLKGMVKILFFLGLDLLVFMMRRRNSPDIFQVFNVVVDDRINKCILRKLPVAHMDSALLPRHLEATLRRDLILRLDQCRHDPGLSAAYFMALVAARDG